MRVILQNVLFLVMLLIVPNMNFGQAPPLGTASSFALFTAAGAVNNTGVSIITGDIGTNVGAFNGFPPGIIIGAIHVADPESAQASTDVITAYGDLAARQCSFVLGTTLGNNQILGPNTYCLGAASTLVGDLILDGEGNPNSLFIFQIDGALSTDVLSNVNLINGASLCNVYWQINGAVSLGENSIFRGTIIAAGALNFLQSATLLGRGLSVTGAINLNTNNVSVTFGLPPTSSTIVALGPTTFCEGGSVMLTGNLGGVWNTGESATSITVNTSGEYFVTNSNDCGNAISNIITVTVNPLPICLITGDDFICAEEQSTELCAPVGYTNYLWSTGASTSCITISTGGTYSVTVTDVNGCSSNCSKTVTVNPMPMCMITGNDFICPGQTAELCTLPGNASYMWSTGETTNCITVSAAGTFSVTITSTSGCISICSKTVASSNSQPTITCPADVSIECDESTLPPNTGIATATDNCSPPVPTIDYDDTVSGGACPQEFTILRVWTATNSAGNSISCVQTITIEDNTPPLITCPTNVTVQCTAQIPPVSTTLVVSSDNCVGATTVTHVGDIITNQTCANRYALTRAYRATDACGNITNCAQVITVFDSTPPTVTCPTNATVQCASQVPAVNTALVAASDNCGGAATVTLVGDIVTNQTCANRYTLTRTYQAADACGNLATCAQVITVFDSTPPTVSCPTNATVQCASQVPAINTALVAASDNCGGTAIVTHIGDAISNQVCANQFVLTRTYRATDVCGNVANCTQVITVFDNIPPTINFTDPLVVPGSTINVQCFGQDPNWNLPTFNAGSVTASDICAGNVTITFNEVLENAGDCDVDGYINRYRLTWTATDVCGNSSSTFLFLALIDTIPPVIFGVPADITVNCNEIPELPTLVYATDGCLCACVMFSEETVVSPYCQNGQVIVRTWKSMDDCGNIAVETQNITLIDTIGPDWFILLPELAGITSDTILNYSCNDGYPAFLDLLNEQFALGPNSCGASFVLSFDTNTTIADNCEQSGYLEQRTFHWVGVDDCGNLSELTIHARLDDVEPPVVIGVPDTTCLGDPQLGLVYATDACGTASVQFQDYIMPNPCGSGKATRRIYVAQDDCGNIARDTAIIIPNDNNEPTIWFVNPVLEDMQVGEVLTIDCAAQNGQYTSFGPADVNVEDGCPAGLTVNFTETLVSLGDCATDGVVAIVELKWTATDVCGNSSELIVTANIVDETSPVFVNFSPEVTIACNAELPELLITDNCGDVTTSTWDTIIYGDCIFEYDMQRIITATDVCGNTTTQQQTIHVGDGNGPVISVIEEVVCNDVSIPDVTAYDSCAQAFVDVTMQEDTLNLPCDGLVIERTWTAVDICGNVAISHQTIIINDETPPVIEVPLNSIIQAFLDSTYHLVYTSQNDMIAQLNTLDSTSVFIADDCDQSVVVVFTVEISYADNCLEDGYFERRKYTWVATDVCGNSTTFSFSVDIADNTPPALGLYPSDITIVCEELPAIPIIIADDGAQSVTIVFTEVIEPGVGIGVFIVTRKWTATDACGNVTVYVQHIKWIPDTFLECNIILPDVVNCNTHGIVINSSYTGGNGPLTYNWEIVGEDCFIQGGQGTPKITVYVGWSDVKIILTVTDAFGCVTMCMVTQSCQFSVGNLNAGLPSGANAGADVNGLPTQANENHLKLINLWPNPANRSVNLGYESPLEEEIAFSFTNYLGQVVLSGRIDAQIGYNAHKIDVSQVREGSYLVQIKTEKELLTKIVVIMRNN